MNHPRDPTSIRRSLSSYGDRDFHLYMRRAFLASAGYGGADLKRPIIGVADTTSDYHTCHHHMAELIAAIRRGVLDAGGLPFVFPTSSWNEVLTSPTTMLFRNLAAMETEELIRAQPMDAVVLVGGCDKTVPAQLMAAASANLPALVTVVGPTRTGSRRGERLGACTGGRRMWAHHRAEAGIQEDEQALYTAGTCMVMGTASTMACLAEALGMMLPGGASPPSGSAARLRHAVATGRRAVELSHKGPTPREVLTPVAFRNAVRVLAALGGSTNAVIHLAAIAGRVGLRLELDEVDRIAVEVPLLVDCKPAGQGSMEEFDLAGGVPALLRVLAPLLELEVSSAAVTTLGERLAEARAPGAWQRTIRTLEAPLGPSGGLRVLRGSLAPDGAIIKAAAASTHLLRHCGPAKVFESAADVADRIDDPSLGITAEHVLVLRNAGPVAAGMPEAGALPIPAYLAAAGVRDLVRVSDARMSGTARGTIVLHCAPEAAIGGPLALVQDGDLIELDVAAGRLELLVEAEELARRRAAWTPPLLPMRGWARLYCERVQQAPLGADLEFLSLLEGGPVAERHRIARAL